MLLCHRTGPKKRYQGIPLLVLRINPQEKDGSFLPVEHETNTIPASIATSGAFSSSTSWDRFEQEVQDGGPP